MTKKTYRDKPYYDSTPIASLETLANILEVRLEVLQDITVDQERHYHSFVILTGRNGKQRHIHEPKHLLKKVQKRINSRIFSNVNFPEYLQGGIKDDENPRDYYTNALSHVDSKFVLSMDIRSFYDNIKIEHVAKVFQHLFHFHPQVAELLAKLVTFGGKVPQGAVPSSYIANLVFYENEYKIVSKLRQQGILYTRLLDDVAISAKKEITPQKKERIIKDIAAMARKSGVKLNNKKTEFVTRNTTDGLMKVTGLWVNHKQPKCLKDERKNIRTSVYQCEQEYLKGHTSDDYHKMWNRASGRVTKLWRVGHPQAVQLRRRLDGILPEVSDARIREMKRELAELETVSTEKRKRVGYLKRVNKLIYLCGILTRTHKKLAKSMRLKAKALKPVATYDEFWEV